jgi:hypothetical protein
MKTNVKTTQEKIILTYLQDHTATASMASKATGLSQKNICRIKRNLEQRGLLREVARRKCKVTGFLAWYLSTNIIRQVPSVLQEIRNAKKKEND